MNMLSGPATVLRLLLPPPVSARHRATPGPGQVASEVCQWGPHARVIAHARRRATVHTLGPVAHICMYNCR